MAHMLLMACVVLVSLGLSSGHGFLREPPSRNVVDPVGNGFCPHCGNGGSSAHPGSVCGDGNQWPSDDYYLKHVQPPQRTYVAGSIVKLEVSMKVDHRGHHEFFICDHTISDNEGAVECWQRWQLQRVPPEELHDDCLVDDPREDCQPIDTRYPGRWYHMPGKEVHVLSYRIPRDLTCSTCTLLWFWPTGNSHAYDEVSYTCYEQQLKAMGWSGFEFCGWACADRLCPDPTAYVPSSSGPRSPDLRAGKSAEEFRNCADIAVVAADPDVKSTSSRVSTTRPPAVSTSRDPVSTTSSSIRQADLCIPIGDCSGLGWCDMSGLQSWCASHCEATTCPRPFCKWVGGSGSAPDHGEETTPSDPKRHCVSTPGLNRGVSDADCAQCLGGYEWWPCNDLELCTCTGGEIALVSARVASRGQALGDVVRMAGTQRHIVGPALVQSRALLSRQTPLPRHEL